MFDTLFSRIRCFFSGNERSVTVKKNAVYSVLIRCVSIAVSFLIVPLTIGYVSAELYGVWLTLSSIMTWMTFLDMGFTQGLKNRLAESIALNNWERGKQLVSTTYFMMLLIFIPVCIILLLLIPQINWCSLLNIDIKYSSDVSKVLIVVVCFACLQMVVNTIVSVVAAFQKVALSNLFNVVGNFFSLIFILVLTKTCPPSLLSLSLVFCSMPVLVTIAGSLLLYTGKYKVVAPSVRCVNTLLIKDLFNLGYKFFVINIQVLVLYQSTNVLISNVSSPLMVTSYNLAYRYMNLAMMMYTLITAPLWPAYTEAYTKGDFGWMRHMRMKMQKILLVSVCVAILMVIVSPVFYKVWVGNSAEVPLLMTISVAIYVIIYCWSNLNGTIIVGMGKLSLNTRLVLIGMICHIPVSVFLSKYIGCYGVLMSMIVINAIYAVFFHIQASKLLEQRAKGVWNK